MRTFNGSTLALAAGLVLAPAAFAAPSVTQNFETCRAEAELLYSEGGAPASVRLDDIRKAGRELRLRVVAPDGRSFNAVCEINRKSGAFVSLDPQPERLRRATIAGGN